MPELLIESARGKIISPGADSIKKRKIVYQKKENSLSKKGKQSIKKRKAE